MQDSCFKLKFNIILAIVLYIGLSTILFCKYVMRLTTIYGCMTFAYAIFLFLVLFTIHKYRERYCKILVSDVTLIVMLAIISVAIIFVQYSFDPMQIMVDRWSAIHNVIGAMFQGNFPYSAQTHLGGYASPFPIWMIFHIPFYLLNNVGLSIVVGMLLYILSLSKIAGVRGAITALVLFAFNVNFWYEVSVRSDMITNFLLLCAFINYMWRNQINYSTRTWFVAICCGLWLSTRISTMLPLLVFLFPEYMRQSKTKKIMIPLVIIFVFMLTFLPLAVWDFNYLVGAEYNPFVLQTRQGKLIDSVIVVSLTIIMACNWKNDYTKMLIFSALSLILLFSVATIHSMYSYGTWTELFNSMYDITYLDMSLPFIITVLSLEQKRYSQNECKDFISI